MKKQLTDYERDNYATLRIRTYQNLRDLGIEIDPFKLATFLGHKDFNNMKANFSYRDISICRALCGPHGYAIYKMLMARNGDKTSPL